MAQELFTACSSEELAQFYQILHSFGIKDGHIVDVKPMKSGRLNKTFKITINTPDGFVSLVLQLINTKVFKQPVQLMNNIIQVTKHIQQKGGTTINFHAVGESVPSPHRYLYVDEMEKAYYRLYDFINATFKNEVTSPYDMYTVGRGIGEFSKMLSDFDASKLVETIPDFHDTAKRYEHFVKTCEENPERCKTCQEEINFLNAPERVQKYGLLMEALALGIILLRIAHNDPKLNNIIICTETGEAIGMIDLDTVMPGTVLSDFGDAARFGCNTASEEEKDLSKVSFSIERFKELTRGFLESMKDVITEEEVSYMADAVWMLSIELVIRFLDDHIAGNPYFGADYDGQNLERARVQMKLVQSIEEQWDEINQVIMNTWEEVNAK